MNATDTGCDRDDDAPNDVAHASRTPVAEKVRFLAAPSAYREAPREVSVIETHMAWVFLAGERV